jgi:hypothetical protein
MRTFAEATSQLIDQLRVAQDTAHRMATLAESREKAFAESVAARIETLLDELGCYD